MDGIINAFHEGGILMWPTLLLGCLALALAATHAIRPNHRRSRAALTMVLATLLTGALGTVAGVMASIHYIAQLPPDEQLATALIGLRESLHGFALALLLGALAALASSIGHFRGPSVRPAGRPAAAPGT